MLALREVDRAGCGIHDGESKSDERVDRAVLHTRYDELQQRRHRVSPSLRSGGRPSLDRHPRALLDTVEREIAFGQAVVVCSRERERAAKSDKVLGLLHRVPELGRRGIPTAALHGVGEDRESVERVPREDIGGRPVRALIPLGEVVNDLELC